MGNVVPLSTGGKIAGIIPTTIEEVFRLAKAVAASGLAPKEMSTPEKITVAIMHGLEIGLAPMQAIQRIAVVNGRPTVWGDAIPALLLARGFHIGERIEGTGDARIAYCKVVRPDGSLIERQFSVTDAKVAGLWQTQARIKRKNNHTGEWYEKDNDSPWFRYPDRMLQMRARGFACRDGAADVLAGLYLREEIEEDQSMKDITPQQKQVVLPAIGKALPPVVGEVEDVPLTPTGEARAAIAEAGSIEVLNHLREAMPDADWQSLESEVAARTKVIEAGGVQ
jgi:hypothetical protein